MKRLTMLVLAVLAAAHAPGAPAQQSESNEDPRQRLGRGFEAGAPAVGEPLPDVQAYDASGKPFRLSSLKGSHAVLVFGCLT